MKRPLPSVLIPLLIALFLFTDSNAQELLWETKAPKGLVFQISNREAQRLLTHSKPDTIVKAFLHTVIDTFDVEAGWKDRPEKGHFILATVEDNRVHCQYASVFPYQVFLFKEYDALTIQVLDLEGNVRKDAKVKLKTRRIAFDSESMTYRLPNAWISSEKAIVTVELDDFRSVFNVIRHDVPYWYNYGQNDEGASFYSYMLTDKNRYKPGENVRFKSYALSHSKSPLRRNLELWITGPKMSRRIAEVLPARPGNFFGDFIIQDSLGLQIDQVYSLQLREKKGRIVAKCSFRYEDYELHNYRVEVTLSDSSQYYPASNQVSIKAADVNGLLLKDARAEVIVRTNSIRETFQPIAILPDTLMVKQIALEGDGPSLVEIPSEIFKKNNTLYEVIVAVLTSENHRMEQRVYAVHHYSQYEISTHLVNDSIVYELRKNGEVVPNVRGRLSRSEHVVYDVLLPHKEKINPATEHVTITTEFATRVIRMRSMVPRLDVVGGIERDSFKISLNNPHKLGVSWYVYQGSTLIHRGFGDEMEYKSFITDRDATYYVDLLYAFGGAEHLRKREFPFQEGRLHVSLDMPDKIYPGQDVEATVQVLDAFGKPMNNVDLTALATTAKLGYYLPDLPYYGDVSTPRARSVNYSKVDVDKRSAVLPLRFKEWAARLRLDTMKYYQFAYPQKSGFRYSYAIDDSTQFAPFVLNKGEAKTIYVIEVDHAPVYFSWTQSPRDYSFYVAPGKPHQISLRLHDRVLVMDSVMFEEGKKTILSIDFDNLPDGVVVHKLTGKKKRSRWAPTFTPAEKARYRRYVALFEKTKGVAYLERGRTLIPISGPNFRTSGSSLNVGPVPPATVSFRALDPEIDVTYRHEGGFLYSFEPNVVYKQDAKNTLLPLSLGEGLYSPATKLKVLVMTKEWFFTPRQDREKWHPGIINLVDESMKITLELPDDPDRTGVGAFLFQECSTGTLRSMCRGNNLTGPSSIPRGCNNVIIVYDDGTYLKMDSILFKSFAHVRIDMKDAVRREADSLSREWLSRRMESCYGYSTVAKPSRSLTLRYSSVSAGEIRGVVYAQSDNSPLPGCNIVEKGTDNGTVTDVDGTFSLNLTQESATLVISFIGFAFEEVEVHVGSDITVFLTEDIQMLQEVVVAGYGVQTKSSLTGSIAGVLQGRVPGITIRGSSSLYGMRAADMSGLYELIGGEEQVEESTDEMGGFEEELSGEDELYYELLSLNAIRSNFADVAFWEPDLVTDKNGQAKFRVTFPDDVTRWDATVYAMNRRLQTGTARKSIKSYKPLMAELQVPRFLTRGDSAMLVGKVLNHTGTTSIKGNVEWTSPSASSESSITLGSIHTEQYPLVASSADSLTMRYVFRREDGYVDGEERTIPIIEQGVLRANGTLTILNNGDRKVVRPGDSERVTVEIVANPLDIYAGEVRNLLNYRFACNEQLASKLQGLVNHKMLMEYEGKPFKNDRDIKRIIARLLKNQNEEFLWSWWDVSANTAYWMSAHILRALHSAKKAGYDVNLDLNNVVRKATHRFEFLEQYHLHDIDLLNALAAWGAPLNYGKYVSRLEGVVKSREKEELKKKQASRYSYLREKLLLQEIRLLTNSKYQRDSVTHYLKHGTAGEIFFDDDLEGYRWYRDDLMTNVAAYRIVTRDSVLASMKGPMQLYFLNSRRRGEWNTYQSSSILMAVLSDLLTAGVTRDSPASVSLSGKFTGVVSEFPLRIDVEPGEELHMEKVSGMPIYFMQYVTERVVEAKNGVDGFNIKTSINNGNTQLEAGKPTTLRVEVEVSKDASFEHVMIEVPIPGACSYAGKPQPRKGEETYREYFQDRVAIFCESMAAGKHYFDIPLLPRFSGRYFVNPAQVSLMYLPVVNANTGMKRVVVSGEW